MPQIAVRYSDQQLRGAVDYAKRHGITRAEALRRGKFSPKTPKARWKWCLEDFKRFCLGDKTWPGLLLPEGTPFRLEGHQLLILKEAFAPELVELLCLIPKGNLKTATFAALAVFHVDTVPNARCYVGAADKIQAQEMYDFAAHFAEPPEPDEDAEELEQDAYDYLSESLRVRRSTREVRSRRDNGFIRVLASDDSKQGGKRQGFNPTLALIDELHAHEKPHLYEDMRTGLFKRQGRLLTATTAGWDETSVLGSLRTGMLELDQAGGTVETGLKTHARTGKTSLSPDGRLTIARAQSGRSVMLEWACTPEDDLDDPRVVKLANPASSVTIESLEDAREAPGISPWAFARYRANFWTLGFESWLPEGAWEALAEPQISLIDNANTFVGVDMGRYHDCSAVVVVQPRDNLPAVVKAQIWPSGGKDNPIEYALVMNHLRELDKRYRLLAVAFDDKYFDMAAEELHQEGLPMVKFDQGNARRCPADANLRAAILRGSLRHDGDPVLTAHVRAGATKDVGEAWRLVKSKENGPPIDATVALSMAHHLAFFQQQPSAPFIEVV